MPPEAIAATRWKTSSGIPAACALAMNVSDIAASAISAQSQRLNVVASNLANADAVAGPDGQAYRARQVVFETRQAGRSASTAGVQVSGVVEDATPEWLGASFLKLEFIEDWCKNVRAEIERRAFAGETVPNVKVVLGKKPKSKGGE